MHLFSSVTEEEVKLCKSLAKNLVLAQLIFKAFSCVRFFLISCFYEMLNKLCHLDCYKKVMVN